MLIPVAVVWMCLTNSGGHAPAPAVAAILHADMTPEARLKALAPFFQIGSDYRYAERALGRASSLAMHGPGFMSMLHHTNNGHFFIGVCPDGEIWTINYTDKAGRTAHRTSGPVEWPRGLRVAPMPRAK